MRHGAMRKAIIQSSGPEELPEIRCKFQEAWEYSIPWQVMSHSVRQGSTLKQVKPELFSVRIWLRLKARTKSLYIEVNDATMATKAFFSFVYIICTEY